jgi:hypothetical protein
MANIEFQGFGKISRLFRDIVITEKIDGTNAAIGILSGGIDHLEWEAEPDLAIEVTLDGWDVYTVYAQSRKRLITPTKDNHGFAQWVHENAVDLAKELGPGLHFGEWWGSGIQRGYGLPKGEKRFSLFNVKRWSVEWPVSDSGGDEIVTLPRFFKTKNLGVVPVIYRGPFNTADVNASLRLLAESGSLAAPGYDKPEGIVVYHTQANQLFKVTILNDEVPKTACQSQLQ